MVFLCVPACQYAHHVHKCLRRTEGTRSLGVEFQVLMSHPTWVLENSPCPLQGQQVLSEPSSRLSTSFSLRQSLMSQVDSPALTCWNDQRLTLLPPPVESWDYRHGVAILVDTFWGMEPQSSCMLVKHVTSQAPHSPSSCLPGRSCLVPCDWFFALKMSLLLR